MQDCVFTGDRTDRKKHFIIFSGQGSPALGMGREVCDISVGTKAIWDCASDISGIDVRSLCRKGPMVQLAKTHFQQLAITTVNAAMLTLLREKHNIEEIGMAGHSLGEYTALYATGVVNLETLFKAVTRRGEIMQRLAEKYKGVMYALKSVNSSRLNEIITHSGLTHSVSIACDNAASQQVIGGEPDAVKEIVRQLAGEGISAVKLVASGAWHTPLMREGVNDMRALLASLPFSPPRKPLFMNRTAAAENDVGMIKENLAQHIAETVRWRETMDAWWRSGYRDFLELGHKRTLCHLVEMHFNEIQSHPDFCIEHFSTLMRTQTTTRQA